MAILGIEGFDHMETGSSGFQRLQENESYTQYNTVTDANGIIDSTETPFSYGNCIRLNYGRWLKIAVDTSAATYPERLYVGFHYYVEDPANEAIIFGLIDTQYNGQLQCYYAIDAVGHIKFYRYSGAFLAQSTLTLTPNTWHWIEAYTIVHPSAGACTIKVNGTTFLQETGLNTQSSSTPPVISGFMFGYTNTNKGQRFDDVVWQDSEGDFLGPSRIETFTPSGDIPTPEWNNSVDAGPPDTVTNASTIDEIPAVDTDYVYSNTSGAIDLYSVNTISASDTIHAVGVECRAKKSAIGTIAIQSRSYDGTTTPVSEGSNGGVAKYLALDWVGYNDVFETTNNEDTDDTAWTKALFDDAQFGLKVI